MVMFFYPRNLPPRQLSEFGSEVERSVKGSLYLRPGSLIEVTDSEWAWIEAHYPEVGMAARVAPRKQPPVIPRAKPFRSEAVKEKTSEAEIVADSEDAARPEPESEPEEAASSRKWRKRKSDD